jgi:diguanylate cyclase (GGDEF)-like protein
VQLGEEKLERAVRVAGTRGRDQTRRLRWTLASASSYAVDTLFLALFSAAGTVAPSLAIAYGAAAAAICAAAYAVTASGLNLRARDPNLAVPLMIVAVALQFGVVAVAPQVAFPFLANLFTVFAFGMIWITLRQSVVVWTVGALATGVLFYAVGERLSLPVATATERALAWLYFSLILARCLVLSVQANELRGRLAEGRAKLAESLDQMRQLASHDELTRTLNRRSLMARLEQERSRAERGGTPFSVALLDLDHFKAVNDSYGHPVGDDVLRAFAKTAHGAMRDSDAFGRYGGEEFMFIFGATAPAAALAAVERVRAAFAARDWESFAPGLRVTVSAGVAGYQAGERVSQLVGRADAALYEAKRAGRNCVIVKEQP